MRRQERETMERDKYNGDQLYVGGRRRDDDSFPEKNVTFYFNRPHNPDVDARSQGVGSSKDFEI
jgi:ribosome modulation factor